jgi:L-ornithine Nalpha-acyltransferase
MTGLFVRLARSGDDVAAAQRLRYHVFYEERGALPNTDIRNTASDADRFDSVCDHLMVIDRGSTNGVTVGDGKLVGTYRLLRQDMAENNFGFYSQSEFDVAALIAAKPHLRFLELGRSCVLPEHRSKPVVELLWQGIWDYVRAQRMDVMFGCASFDGTDPEVHRDALTVLRKLALAPSEWRVDAHRERRLQIAGDGVAAMDDKRVLASLPPLIKGYLRLGCYIGEGAVIDPQFNTTDVLIILPVSAINPRYFARFGLPEAK